MSWSNSIWVAAHSSTDVWIDSLHFIIWMYALLARSNYGLYRYWNLLENINGYKGSFVQLEWMQSWCVLFACRDNHTWLNNETTWEN